jgi:hypothetical protein
MKKAGGPRVNKPVRDRLVSVQFRWFECYAKFATRALRAQRLDLLSKPPPLLGKHERASCAPGTPASPTRDQAKRLRPCAQCAHARVNMTPGRALFAPRLKQRLEGGIPSW